MKELISKFLTRNAHSHPKFLIYFYYLYKLRKFPNIKKPRTLNEKIQWLKINEFYKNKYTICADKYKVRTYIQEKGCGDILNDLYGVYDQASQIDFANLPKKFALKCNHGAGYNIICDDMTRLDVNKVITTLNTWMQEDFSSKFFEPQYKEIERKIICEKYIENKQGEFPDDYKFYCFDGKPYAVMVCKGRKGGNTKFYYYDMDWNQLPLSRDSIDAINNHSSIPKPEGFEIMKGYSELLSQDFKFVRTDFYLIDGRVMFGELTFTPSAGFDSDRLSETDKLFGNKLNLDF